MTYLGSAGRSVIDYIITNRSGEEKIKKLEIKEGISSDHLMLQLELYIETEEEKELEKDGEVTIWNEESLEDCRNWLE